MHPTAKIVNTIVSVTRTPIRSAIRIIACINDHDHDTGAISRPASVGIHPRGLQLIADATGRAAARIPLAVEGSLEDLLIDGTRVVSLANVQRGPCVALPVGRRFVVVPAITGCAHICIVLPLGLAG